MKFEKYVSLIRELEIYAAKNPKTYRYKVMLLSLLGYAYIIGLILLLLLFPGLVLTGLLVDPANTLDKILLPLLKIWFVLIPLAIGYFGILGGLLKAFTVKAPEPNGEILRREAAPALFAFIQDTCKKLSAAKPQKIFVTDEFNASIVTVPRIGMFGSKTYMVLGLPLMEALSVEQFQAVITHEIGHISGRHGSFAKWAYQLHQSWGLIIESQEATASKASVLYDKFVNWFFPYFSAYSFVLMREHEREADGYAVQYVGAAPLGEALVTLDTKRTMLSEVFWKQIDRENGELEVPAGDIYSRLVLSFRNSDRTRDITNIEKAVQFPTDFADTHPSLAERLTSIGYWDGSGIPRLPGDNVNSAAEFYLGGLVGGLTEKFNQEWKEKAGVGWKERYEGLQKADERLNELSVKDELTPDELFEKAELTAELKERKESQPILQELVRLYPDHANGNYALGMMLLEENDETGFDLLRRSVELDKKLKLQANQVAFQYLRAKGRFDEAKNYADALEQNYEEFANAEKERAGIFLTDTMVPHKVSEENLEAIRRLLGYHEEIVTAFIVSKELKYFSDIPFHGLFIVFDLNRSKTTGITAQDIIDTLAKQVFEHDVNFIYCFDPQKDRKGLDKVKQVEGSRIYTA